MKKRLLALALVLCMVLTIFAACGSDDGGDANSDAVIYEYDYDLSEYIKIGEYKGLEYTPKKLVVAEGDSVSVSYVGRMDGEEFEGGTGTNNNLVIGSGSFIDGFEDGLVGMVPGETKDLELTFPDPYPNNPDFAGKPVVFTATVNSINGNESEEDMYKSEIWQKYYDSCEVIKYPEKEVNDMKEQQKEYYENLAASYGTDFDGLLSAMSMSAEDFDKQLEEYAQSMIAQDMALYALARAEGIEAEDEYIEKAKQGILDSYGFESEKELKDSYGIDFDDPEIASNIEMNAILQKTLDFMLENAKEAAPESAE